MNVLVALLLTIIPCVSAATYQVWPGETTMVEVNVSAGETSPQWTTNNPTLQLQGSGFYRNVTATAYFGGTATVTCTYTYRLGTSQYQRSKSWTFSCLATDVSVSPTSVTLAAGETEQLSWSFNRTTYMTPTMQFTSADDGIATVSSSGLITAKSSGTTTIYARSNIGINNATCRVTVTGGGNSDDTPDSGGSGTRRTIRLTEAGTLGTYISEADKYTITELTVSGPLNGTDLRLIRDMAGSDPYRKSTNGKLEKLDLRDALFVRGGSWYVEANNEKQYTENYPTQLPPHAFIYCNKLTHLYLPKYIESIDGALSWCDNLIYVEIPVGVSHLSGIAFSYLERLSTITIPSTVQKIGTRFYDDYSLTDIYCHAANVPVISNGIYSKTNVANGTLYVPKGCADEYWRADGWNDFSKMVELPDRWYEIRLQVETTGGCIKYGDSTVRKEFADILYDGIESFDITEGGTATFDILPDEGYAITKVVLNDEDITASVTDNKLTIINIYDVKNINVQFGTSADVAGIYAQKDIQVSVCGGEVVVKGVKNGEIVKVFNISGGLVASVCSDGQECRIQLPKGAYIVSASGSSFKVLI